MEKLKQFWASLPHSVQAGLVAFGGGFVAALVHAYSDTAAVWTLSQLKHELPTFLASGFVALRAYLMLPNNPPSTADKTPQTPPPGPPAK